LRNIEGHGGGPLEGIAGLAKPGGDHVLDPPGRAAQHRVVAGPAHQARHAHRRRRRARAQLTGERQGMGAHPFAPPPAQQTSPQEAGGEPGARARGAVLGARVFGGLLLAGAYADKGRPSRSGGAEGGGGDGAGSGSGEGSARGGTTTASTGSRYTGSFGGSGSIENLIGILRTSILGCGDADVAPVIGPDAAVSDPRARERRLNCTLH